MAISPKQPFETDIPTQEEATKTFTLAVSSRQQHTRNSLSNIANDPPQVLILEGGNAEERLSIALWYTAILNCEKKEPCLTCPICLQIGAKIFHDLFLLHGSEGGIKIDDVRTLRTIIGKSPYGKGKKVILLAEAQYLRIEAANALLKSLEEPHPETCFVILTPQRKQLLSTIISRGWTITLPWMSSTKTSIYPEVKHWEELLIIFLLTGKNWFNQDTSKTSISAELVQQLIISIRKAIIMMLTKKNEHPLTNCLSILPPTGIMYLQDVLTQSEESLMLTVNPSLILNWMATRLYLAYNKAKKLSLAS